MKKIVTLIMVLLALHFLAVVGGVGYLVGTGKLDKAKAGQVMEVLFPPAAGPTTAPTSQPATQPAEEIKPLMKLEEMLARQAGRPATEQVEFIRNSFDEQNAQIERRMRELEGMQRQIEAVRYQLARDRSALDARQKALDARETETARQEKDAGFQAELQLYQSMPPGQVKKVFLGLEDEAVARYLQAMPPRQATKIIKEFKTPEEMARLQLVLDRVRKSGGALDGAAGGGPASSGGGPNGSGGGPNGSGGGPNGSGGGPSGTSSGPSGTSR